MSHAMKWLAAAGVAIAVVLGDYWSRAPGIIRAAVTCLPIVTSCDMIATVLSVRLVYSGRPPTRADEWQAVTVRAILTVMLVALSFTADTVSGVSYSFVSLALVWGYATHLTSALKHMRGLAIRFNIPFPSWADELDDRARQIQSGQMSPAGAAAPQEDHTS